jgi:acetyltransferase-like isoleucine patch superfamily enzyme
MLIKILIYFIREMRMKRDPVGYARSLGVRIGNNCHLYAMRADMFGSDPFLITLGNDVHVTNGVKFITHDGGTLIFWKDYPDLDVNAPIIVGDNVFVGTCAMILPGVTIGNNCVIGAGPVVTRNIPCNSLAAGVPARVIKPIDKYLETLQRKSIGCGKMSPAKKAAFLKQCFCKE